MTSLAQARTLVAGAINDAGLSVNVHTRPLTAPDAGDGWVVIGRVAPAGYSPRCTAELSAVVVLGSDPDAAEQRVETLAVPLVNAVADALNVAGVELTPQLFQAGLNASADIYALVLTLTIEVG